MTPHDTRHTRCSASRMKIKAPSTTDDVQNTLQNSCMRDSESVESSKPVRAEHNINSRPRFNTKALQK